MSEISTTIEKLYEELCQLINSEQIQRTKEVKDEYTSDRFFKGIEPSLVISPNDASEVSIILKLCNKFSIPVTPRSSKVTLHGKSLLSCGINSNEFYWLKRIIYDQIRGIWRPIHEERTLQNKNFAV